MPEVKIERIVSVSSEDPIFKAENLLKKLKWRCQNNGEQQVSVVLQLNKSLQIRLLETLGSILPTFSRMFEWPTFIIKGGCIY